MRKKRDRLISIIISVGLISSIALIPMTLILGHVCYRANPFMSDFHMICHFLAIIPASFPAGYFKTIIEDYPNY